MCERCGCKIPNPWYNGRLVVYHVLHTKRSRDLLRAVRDRRLWTRVNKLLKLSRAYAAPFGDRPDDSASTRSCSLIRFALSIAHGFLFDRQSRLMACSSRNERMQQRLTANTVRVECAAHRDSVIETGSAESTLS